MTHLDSRPLLTFDLDGVLCSPPFGINPGRKIATTNSPKTSPRMPSILWFFERWRYRGRRPMPEAVKAFSEFQKSYRCVIVSARSEAARKETETWLEQYFQQVPDLFLRPTWRETPSEYKARVIQELNSLAHFEDDPRTAILLSNHVSEVFLIAWPRNQGVSGAQIQRIEKIGDARAYLEKLG